MTTNKIRYELEKLKTLAELYARLLDSAKGKPQKELDEISLKMKVIKEDMLKENYEVGKLLKAIEEKV